jgi:6-pyruvoyl-tetrahydropterin synthase
MSRLPYLKKIQTDIVPALSCEGEIYDGRKNSMVFIAGEEDFTFWFTHLTSIVRTVKQLSDFKLLYWISTHISYNEGLICLNKVFKEKIEKEVDISQTAINRSIASLKAFNILIPYAGANRSAFFHVNPCFIWKGDKSSRLKRQEFILRMANMNNLPDKEKEVYSDIERYQKAGKSKHQQ